MSKKKMAISLCLVKFTHAKETKSKGLKWRANEMELVLLGSDPELIKDYKYTEKRIRRELPNKFKNDRIKVRQVEVIKVVSRTYQEIYETDKI